MSQPTDTQTPAVTEGDFVSVKRSNGRVEHGTVKQVVVEPAVTVEMPASQFVKTAHGLRLRDPESATDWVTVETVRPERVTVVIEKAESGKVHFYPASRVRPAEVGTADYSTVTESPAYGDDSTEDGDDSDYTDD